MTLEFTTMTSAGRFGDACEFPILDLRPIVPDDVLKSIPRFMYRWENGTTQTLIIDDNFSFTDAADDCDFTVASRETLECLTNVPNQKKILVGESNVDFEQFMKRFCKAKSLVQFPTVFNGDGSINRGDPFAGPFLRYIIAELRGAYMQKLISASWTGDQDNRHELDGILTQLADTECDWYAPTVVDWNTWVAGAGAASSPSATIDATQDTQIIRGQAFSGLTGLNLVEFIRLYMERLMDHDLARWSEETVEFDWWVPRGSVSCIADDAACLQPCSGCVDPLSDPNIRERASEFRRTKRIWLYPWDNIIINLRTSPNLDNRMLFMPKTIGGRPTIGWVFRDQQEELNIINGELPFYGSQVGLPSGDTFPGDGPITPGEFEQRAFRVDVQKNGDCLDFWMKSTSAILLQSKHLYVDIQNVSCTNLVPQIATALSYTPDSCVTTDDHTLTFVVSELDGATEYVTPGDTWAIYWEDGTMAFVAVSSWDDGTDTLVLANDIAAMPTTTVLSCDYAATTAVSHLVPVSIT